MKLLYVSSNGGIHDYRFLKKLTEDYEVLFLHYAANEIISEIDNLEKLKIISKKPAFKSFPLLSESRHFRKIVNEFRPNLIHTGYVWQVGILAALSGFHPHLSMPWGSDILIEPDKSYLLKKIVGKVLSSCDHIQCDAEFVKHKMMLDYGVSSDKITVFPWGIDLILFNKMDKIAAREQLNISSNKFIIIFNRYLEKIYGVQFLLEAFKIFSEHKDDVQLLMLSEGSMKNQILKFITDNKFDSKINLVGKVSNNELPGFLNCSDIYVSSSLSDGTSLSLLEAMACGLGLVVTDVPAIKEWVSEQNGIVVQRMSAEALAEGMQTYYDKRDLINKHGKKNIEIAQQRADWDNNYRLLKQIYEELIIS